MYILLARHTLSERTLLSKMCGRVSTLDWAIAVAATRQQHISDMDCFIFIADCLIYLTDLTPFGLMLWLTMRYISTHKQINRVGDIGNEENDTLDAVKLVFLERIDDHIEHESRYNHHRIVYDVDGLEIQRFYR